MMTVRGSEIYDADDNKIGTLSEVKKVIEGEMDGIMCAALWYCFVR
jgi:hypothetical protein